VTPAPGGVQVTKVAEDRPIARGGLRTGDQVLAVDGTKVDSPDSLRRVLRHKHALGEPMTLQVQRDGKPLKLMISPLADSP
jgi:S1-C subfamily serine protease